MQSQISALNSLVLQLKADKEELSNVAKQHELAALSSEQAKETAEEGLQSLKDQLAQRSAALGASNDAERRLQNELEALRDTLSEREIEAVSRRNEVDILHARLEKIRASGAPTPETHVECLRQISELKDQCGNFERQAVSIKHEKSELVSQVDSLKKKLDSLKTEQATEREELERMQQQLADAVSERQQSTRDATEARQKAEEYRRSRENVEFALKEWTATCERLEGQLRDSHSNYLKAQDKSKQLADKVEELEYELACQREVEDRLRECLSQEQTRRSEFESQALMNEDRLRQELVEERARRQAMEGSRRQMEKRFRDQLQALQRQVEGKSLQVKAPASADASLQVEIRMREQVEKALEKALEEVDRLEKEIATLSAANADQAQLELALRTELARVSSTRSLDTNEQEAHAQTRLLLDRERARHANESQVLEQEIARLQNEREQLERHLASYRDLSARNQQLEEDIRHQQDMERALRRELTNIENRAADTVAQERDLHEQTKGSLRVAEARLASQARDHAAELLRVQQRERIVEHKTRVYPVNYNIVMDQRSTKSEALAVASERKLKVGEWSLVACFNVP